jgi:hypothetical protein
VRGTYGAPSKAPETLHASDHRIDLLGADDGHGDDRHVERERESREARAEASQAVAVSEGLGHTGHALREEQQGLALAQHGEGILARGDDAAAPLVEGRHGAEVLDEAVVEEAQRAPAVAIDGGDEHRAVDRDGARVIGDEDRRPGRRDVMRTGRLDAEVAVVQEDERALHTVAERGIESEDILAGGGDGVDHPGGWRDARCHHACSPPSAQRFCLPAAL